MQEWSLEIGGNFKREIWQWYSIQGFIVPTTGWNNKFKYLGRRFMLRITKPSKVNE